MTTSFFTLGRKNWLCFSTTEMKGLWPWPLPFQKDTHALLGLACTFTVLFIPFPVLEKRQLQQCHVFCFALTPPWLLGVNESDHTFITTHP